MNRWAFKYGVFPFRNPTFPFSVSCFCDFFLPTKINSMLPVNVSHLMYHIKSEEYVTKMNNSIYSYVMKESWVTCLLWYSYKPSKRSP